MTKKKDIPDVDLETTQVETTQVEVVATGLGFHDGSLVNPGDHFYVRPGHKAKWFKPVDEVEDTDLTGDTAANVPTPLSQLTAGAKTFVEAMAKK